jgi:hypothetical protein
MLSNIYGMRPREVWFWLGAGFLTVGAVLAAVAIAYFTKETHYSLGTGPQMVMAYAAFALAFLCFFAGIAGWRPWLRWQRFPNITVRVDSFGYQTGSQQIHGFPPRPVRLAAMNVHITNAEVDRRVSIRAAYLMLKAKPGTPVYEQLFTKPFWPVERDRRADVLKLPLNLSPQESGGGELVFELVDYLEIDPAGGPGRIEIHDAISGKMASFPAAVVGGIYRRRHGLRATTYEERVTGPRAAQPRYRAIGSSDRPFDVLTWPWRFPADTPNSVSQ